MTDVTDPHKVGIVDSGCVPQTPGVHTGTCVATTPRMRLLQRSASMTLADLAGEFVLFTHALFFTHGHMVDDPVSDFINHHAADDAEVAVLDFAEVVIAAMPETDVGRFWSTKYLACPVALWPDLLRHLGGVAGISLENRWYWLSGHMEIMVPDVLAMQRMAVLPQVLPTVPLHVFCVASYDATYGLCKSRSGFCMAVAKAKPLPRIVEAAAKVLPQTDVHEALIG